MNTNHKLTHSQRKLLHAIIKDIRLSKRDLIVSLNGVLAPLPLYTVDAQTARNLLKLVDLDYPRDKKGNPESQASGILTTTQMADHIRFIEQSAIESGIKLHHYEKELERLSNFSNKETVFVN